MIAITEKERARRRYVEKATSPGNATLNKRTAGNERGLNSRLGYNTASTVYSPSTDIDIYSGSSLNRSLAKKKRDEDRALSKAVADSTKKRYSSDSVFSEYESEIFRLRQATINQPRVKREISKSFVKREKFLHFLSQRTKGKIRDKCTALHRCLGDEKTFATLTFIDDLSDRTGQIILNKFLTALREKLGKFHYIWVAERQTKTTGRIHFHIILNKRLPVREFNALWVLQQYNEGLQFENLTREDILSLIKHDEENPGKKSELQKRLNPFDVEKITTIYNLSYYLTKYITKGNNKSGFDCAAWHCSRAVSRLFTKVLISRSTFNQLAHPGNCSVSKKGVVTKRKPEIGKFHILFYVENKVMFLPEMKELEELNYKIAEEGYLPPGFITVERSEIESYLN